MPIQIKDTVAYNTVELAELLKLNIYTVRKMIQRGQLAGRKIGRNFWVTADEVERLVKGEETRPKRGKKKASTTSPEAK